MVWPAELFRVPRWLIAVVTLFMTGTFALAISAGIRAQRLVPHVGQERLVGAEGIAKTDCSPIGTVQTKGELWSAVAEGDQVAAGDRIKVVGWDGLRLRVTKVLPEQDGSPPEKVVQ